MDKKVLFIIAPENFKDEEYNIPKKIMEDAGIIVKTASITTEKSEGVSGTEVIPDIAVKDANIDNYDALIIAGGSGAPILKEYDEVLDIINAAVDSEKLVAAICIAPTILAAAGILEDKKATVFPSPDAIQALQDAGCEYTEESVTIDGKIITGNGPASAEEFGNAIVKALSKI